MQLERPYFMSDEDWYYFDAKNCRYVLTDKATKEAKKSYEEFYKQLEGGTIIE